LFKSNNLAKKGVIFDNKVDLTRVFCFDALMHPLTTETHNKTAAGQLFNISGSCHRFFLNDTSKVVS